MKASIWISVVRDSVPSYGMLRHGTPKSVLRPRINPLTIVPGMQPKGIAFTSPDAPFRMRSMLFPMLRIASPSKEEWR